MCIYIYIVVFFGFLLPLRKVMRYVLLYTRTVNTFLSRDIDSKYCGTEFVPIMIILCSTTLYT